MIAVNEQKRPYHAGWNEFFTRPQTEIEIRREFSNGAHGIALVLFPACDYVVLDFDGQHAQEAWQKTGVELPETARHITRSGGQHLFFKQSKYLRDANLSRAVRLVKADCGCTDEKGKEHPCGVDLLLNGIAVIPPTPGYHEDPDHPFEEAVKIPDVVVDLARVSHRRSERANPAKSTDDGISQGERNATLTSLAGSMRRRGMGFEAIFAALREENAQKCNPPLDDREVESIARSIAGYDPAAQNVENLTDIGNSKRFSKEHGEHVRYCFERGGWLIWNSRQWAPDNTGNVVQRAKRTALSIYTEAANEKDPDRRAALAQHAVKSESSQKLQAMLSLARDELPVTLADLDRYPFLLNVHNGIVDLETGALLPHDPALFITQISPCKYDPAARCDVFLSFVDRVMAGNAAVIEFLQCWFGYCLTGDVSEHAVLFAYGSGANGKSTLLKAVSGVMGSYADMAAPNLLLAKRSEEHPAGLADLVGKRLVCTVEIEDGRKFDAALFKWLSGGDVIKARFMRENFFSFQPTHKLTIAANHKPIVSDSSHSFWRRMKLVCFSVQIPRAEQDKRLDEKLAAERDGILAWLVRGALKWRQQGLGEPQEVLSATDGYRSEQDFLAPFLAECCTTGGDYEESVGKLYERFKSWAEESGERPISRKRLSSMLKERGFENCQDTSDHCYYWKGIKLK
jgi:putative DNA primase/helicase